MNHQMNEANLAGLGFLAVGYVLGYTLIMQWSVEGW